MHGFFAAAPLGAVLALLGACSSSTSLFVPRSSPPEASAGALSSPPGEAAVMAPSPDRPDRDLSIGADSTLEDCLLYAAAQSPELEAARQRWVAALERAPQAAALPDPRLTYGYFINEVETRVGPQQHQIGLMQTLPWFGKLGLRESVATKDAEAAAKRVQASLLALRARVADAYNELYHLRRATALTTENLELLGQFERVARARYRVAAAGHPDVIRAQVELGRLEDQLRRLRDLRAPLTANLNAALGRSPDAVAPWPASIDASVLDANDEAVTALLRESNPELLAMADEVSGQRERVALARKEASPDVTLGVTYTVVGERDSVSIPENGDDAVLASVSINLPIWREKYDAAVREAVASRVAKSYERLAMENRLQADTQRALYEHRDAQRRVELYRDSLLPKATESMRASLRAFEAGTSGFLELLDAERTLLEFQLALERARADRATALARLDALIGQPLPRRLEIDGVANAADSEATP